jgi:phosphatidylinositol phospholipase C delta
MAEPPDLTFESPALMGIAPKRILRRAGNLLTSTGHVQPAVKEFIDANSSDFSPSSNGNKPGKLKLGASIKLKFKEVKDGALSRSISSIGRSKSHSLSLDRESGGITSSSKTDSDSDWNLHHDDLKRKKHGRSLSVSEVNMHHHRPPDSPSQPDTRRMPLDTLVITASVPETTQIVTPQPAATNQPEAEPTTGTGVGDVTVPQLLQQGTPMTKVSAKERKRAVFRLDPDIGQIIWETKKHRISASLPLPFAALLFF